MEMHLCDHNNVTTCLLPPYNLPAASLQGDRWSAGRSLLVQLGDLVDRGNETLGVLDLFETLKVKNLKVRAF